VAIVAGAAALAAGGLGLLLVRGQAPRSATAELLTGTLVIRSQPPGAAVLVDGNPSGLVTPATISGLRVGNTVEIRVDKAGFAPATRRLEARAGGAATHDFALAPATGTLRFEELPPNATIFVDDSAVEANGPLSLALGPHRVRVETPDDVIFSAEVKVQPGEQTVRLAPSRRSP
jgi:hypothetical protein